MTSATDARGLERHEPRSRAGSWVDRMVATMARMPGPTWLAYMLLFALLFVILTMANWVDGGQPIGSVRPLDALVAFWPVYFLAVIAHLGDVASSAFSTFRPALDASDDRAEAIRHDLTTMPQVPVTVVWLVFAALTSIGYAADPRMAGVEAAGPVAWTTYTLVQAFAWGLNGAAIFRVLRHARSVARLHRDAKQIDIFDRRPVHAFSRLTASGGVLLVLPVLVGVVIAISVTTPMGLAVFALVALLVTAAATGSFVLPLRGMHDRLVEAKTSRLAECELRIKLTTDEVHRSVDERDRENADALNKTLASLIQERDYLARMPTWPWDASTLRGFITALVLPIVLWVCFRLLERLV